MVSKNPLRAFIILFLAISITKPLGCTFYGTKEDKSVEKVHTVDEAELQSHVMSFADRFAAIMVAAFTRYDTQRPSKENRYEVLATVTYSLSNAYIIAGESDPDIALLDMLSMVILGRIIFEEEGLKRYGETVRPIINGFQKGEKDLLGIAKRVLTAAQIDSLMAIINRWRKNNPEVTFFPFIRFTNFAAERRESKLTRAEEPEGMFDTVEAATEQVEEMRLLAERGMYLATRMPQLTGAFSQIWLANLVDNPDVERFMADFLLLSQVSARLAAVAENFPDQIAAERKATIEHAMESISKERDDAITQFMSELSAERKAVINDFLAEEQRVRGMLSDLRQTLEAGNELIASTNALTAAFGFSESSGEGRPLDIKDIHMTLVELSNSAQKFTELAVTLERISANLDLDHLVSQIVEAMDKAEDEGEELVDHTMRQLIVIIAVWFVGYLIARLVILYVSSRTTTSTN
jgi:hypothetical protein